MSVSIIIHHDPEGIKGRTCLSLQDGARLLDFLIKEYGVDGFNVPTILFMGDIIASNEIKQNYDSLNRILNDGDIVNIIHRPQGVEAIIFAIVAVIAAVVLTPDISPVPTVENPNFPKTNESPNNRLTGQTNLARPLARIPDIYGRMRVYPDLGTSTVTEYINHIKHVTEYLIVGRGEYDLVDLKSGETLLTDIQSASSETFGPGDLINELLNINDSNEVNGQEVKAPNSGDGLNTSATEVTFSSTGDFMRTVGDPSVGLNGFSAVEVGKEFIITGSSLNDGTFTLASYNSQLIPSEPGFDERERVTVRVEESFIDEVPLPGFISFTAVGGEDSIGPFNVPGETEEIWIDIICPRGLSDRRNGSTNTIVVSFNFILEELTSGGTPINVEIYPIALQDNTLDPRFYTFKITPAVPGSNYRATLQRTSDSVNDSSYYDQTKWARLGGVGKIIDFDQGNVTSVRLTTIATEQATKSQLRKFNVIVTRKLRTYTTAGGVIIPALTATTRFADAMLEHLTNEFIGNKVTTDINLDELYTIQESLDVDPIYGDVLGRFSYSFSADKASVKDELLMIANAARVYVRKLGNTLGFGRDEIRSVRTTLFNTRTKKPGSEKKTRRLQKPNGFDGVELQWIEESTGTSFIVKFPDTNEVNPKRIDAAGIRNFKQAWNRANIEFLKLKLQRETVQFDSTKEGLLSPVGDRVANADGTDVKAQSGEVKTIDGFDIETYTPIDFDGNPTAVVLMRDESGALSSEITVTPRLDGIEGFILGTLPGFTVRIRGDLDYQIGTLYVFTLPSTTIKDYVIQSISPKDNGYVTLKLTNYDPLVYGPDTEIPPAPPDDVDPGEPGSSTIVLDPVPSGTEVPIHNVFIEIAATETLAWDLEPTGTYEATNFGGPGILTFIVTSSGLWSVTGEGITVDTDNGDYRPGVTGNDPDNYEVKITATGSGSGTINALGGIILGTFVPLTGGQGLKVTDTTSAETIATVTVEVREIATPANTTGVASFILECDGDRL